MDVPLKTFVEFRSDKFPPCEGEEEEVNPGLYGRRLAEYLHERFTKYGVGVKSFHAEDWGYHIDLECDAFRLWIGCGAQDDEQFLCFIEPTKLSVRRGLFKRVETRPYLEPVVDVFQQILANDPDIHDVRWSTREEFEKPGSV